MIYEDFNEELASSYSRNTLSLASVVNETQLPILGLKASTVLSKKQLDKLREIRKRHLKQDQEAIFIAD